MSNFYPYPIDVPEFFDIGDRELQEELYSISELNPSSVVSEKEDNDEEF